MTLRALREEDLPIIEEMEKRCFADPWTEEMFQSLLRFPFQYAILAEEGGQVCGYCCFSALFEDAELLNIAVDAPYRKRGIGETLLCEMLARVKALGAQNCFLEVRKSNAPAIALYEKYGFTNYGLRERYYGNGEDAVLMKKSW